MIEHLPSRPHVLAAALLTLACTDVDGEMDKKLSQAEQDLDKFRAKCEEVINRGEIILPPFVMGLIFKFDIPKANGNEQTCYCFHSERDSSMDERGYFLSSTRCIFSDQEKQDDMFDLSRPESNDRYPEGKRVYTASAGAGHMDVTLKTEHPLSCLLYAEGKRFETDTVSSVSRCSEFRAEVRSVMSTLLGMVKMRVKSDDGFDSDTKHYAEEKLDEESKRFEEL